MDTVISASPAPSSRASRVLIADSHALARGGLRAMLAAERDLLVVGDAADGAEAVRLSRELRPDLVLLDVRLPALDGVAATRTITAELPATAVVIVTLLEESGFVLAALRAGAAGYFSKEISQHQLVAALRQILRRGYPFPPLSLRALLERATGAAVTPHGGLPERQNPREVAALRLLAGGHTNREIGRELGLAVGTVKVLVEYIVAELGAVDSAQAVGRAVALGLIEAVPG